LLPYPTWYRLWCNRPGFARSVRLEHLVSVTLFLGRAGRFFLFSFGKEGPEELKREIRPLAPGGTHQLTNAFANPLKVCAAGTIIMTPSRPLLQHTSLCCAKMPVSVLDDGGEVMAIALFVRVGSPRRLLGATSRL